MRNKYLSIHTCAYSVRKMGCIHRTNTYGWMRWCLCLQYFNTRKRNCFSLSLYIYIYLYYTIFVICRYVVGHAMKAKQLIYRYIARIWHTNSTSHWQHASTCSNRLLLDHLNLRREMPMRLHPRSNGCIPQVHLRVPLLVRTVV